MDPVIVASLIGAASLAADKLMSQIMEELKKTESSNPLACVFINNTPYEWEQVDKTGEPFHGKPTIPPAARVVSLIEGGEKSGDSDWTETNSTGWGLVQKRRGIGTGIVMVYHCMHPDFNCYAVFYAANPVGRTPPRAGVCLSKAEWFERNMSKHNDRQTKWIEHYIKHGPPDTSAKKQFAYSPKGSYAEAKLGEIELGCQPAEDETRFTMQFNGKWDPFIPKSLLVGAGSQDS